MRESRDDGPFEKHAFAIAAGFLGAFIAVCITDFTVAEAAMCQPTGSCLQGWVSALSGWAAAIGALVAAFVTLKPLRAQLAESRKQTDFILGNAEPTLDYIDNFVDRNITFRVRIVNWNRREMHFNGFNVYLRSRAELKVVNLSTSTQDIIDFYVMPPEVADLVNTIFILPNGRLPGWEDRTKPPSFFEIDIFVPSTTEGRTGLTLVREIELNLRGAGDRVTGYYLKASGLGLYD